jgi:hypothetical protein
MIVILGRGTPSDDEGGLRTGAAQTASQPAELHPSETGPPSSPRKPTHPLPTNQSRDGEDAAPLTMTAPGSGIPHPLSEKIHYPRNHGMGLAATVDRG